MSKALDLENALPAIKSWVLGLLNLKAPLASPALTGTPTAPTASYGTDSTQVATTAFVQDAIDGIEGVSPSSTTPAMDGTATPGSETTYARGDHVHPRDTSKVNKTGDTLTGYLAMSPAAGDPESDNELVTKKYVDNNIPSVPTAYGSTPAMDGTGAAGSSNSWARGDHVHPKDTSKLDKSGGTMTGALTLSGAPTSNLHAATKKYVDDSIPSVPSAYTSTPEMDGVGSAGSSTSWAKGDHVHPSDTSKLSLSGGTMTGALTLSGAPSNNLHAATKKYVDDALAELGTVLNYKGSVATYANLPANPSAGDVYNVEAAYGDYPAGTNWAWSGTAWDALGGAFTITFATAAEVQTVLEASS